MSREEAMANHPAGKGVVVDDEPQVWLLDNTNRCDSCGAQAFVKTWHVDGELEWCGHHYNKYQHVLNPIEILDEREKINEKPSVSANKE